jgi:hypothetical protein
MAISFLTQAQKDVVDSLVDSIHQTFAQDITAFQIDKKSSLSTNPNYNSAYRVNSQQVAASERSQTISARIRYLKADEEVFDYKDGSELTSITNRIVLPAGSVKIKVSNTDNDFMKLAKRVEIADKRYLIQNASNPRPAGFFNNQAYWEYYLVPTT